MKVKPIGKCGAAVIILNLRAPVFPFTSGVLARFVAGIFGSIIPAILLLFLGPAIGEIFGLAAFGGLLGGLVGGSFVLLSLVSAIVRLIGGLIGGALRRG